MIKRIILFENPETVNNLYPLIYMRPVSDLRTGVFTLFEKWQKLFPDWEIKILTREYLNEYWDEYFPGTIVSTEELADENVWVNSQVLPDALFHEIFGKLNSGEGAATKNGVAFVKTVSSTVVEPDSILSAIPEIKINFISYPWDLIRINGEEILKDFRLITGFKQNMPMEEMPEGWLGKENIHASRKAEIYPNVVIDAGNGPVIIDKGVTIQPFTFIDGPVYIGENSVIKAGTRILHGTTIGPVCKISGEISQVICHSFVNKQHDGFLGNSYLSPWVNLGADTVTSNLKNNYSPIRSRIGGREVDTGEIFLGLMAGDHLKSGINTMFNTGTVAGCFANIFGGDFPDKWIPSFAWGGNSPFAEYDPAKAIATARLVKSRRGIKLSLTEEKLINKIFEMTRKERANKG
jgi:UDP-N-acetylglucosamine diphosphorylase/glucosamine-1-phosphate N-acetyltransferase